MVKSKKLIILAAVNGGFQQHRNGAQVPSSPEEIADEALRCYRAGASVIHIHARDKNKQATGDIEVFRDIIRRIREKCDILIQTTNGIGSKLDPKTGKLVWPNDEERLAIFSMEPQQELFSIAGGSWDFYHPGIPSVDGGSFANSTEFLRKVIKAAMASRGSLEFEITEPSYLHKIRRLADEGLFDAKAGRYWFDFCMGFGGMPATPRALTQAVDEMERLFPGAVWEICATHTDQFPLSTMALLMGCDIVRVGFEDNIHLPDGSVARNNGEMVEAVAKIAQIFGREPATTAEARKTFRLGN